MAKIGNVMLIKLENVDDNFINQLRCLIEEYGYQLPMETEKIRCFPLMV